MQQSAAQQSATVRASTDRLPAADRFPYWADVVAQTFVPLECDSLARGTFSGSIRHRRIGRIGITDVRASAQRVKRTRNKIALAPRDDEFWQRLYTREAPIESTGEGLPYSYRLQPGAAPLVFVVPGTGTHRLGASTLALAEMAFAGMLGLRLNLGAVPRAAGLDDDATLLFSESTSRLLVELRPEDAPAFEAALAGLPCARVGEVTQIAELAIAGANGGEVLRASIGELKAAWQGTTVV